MSSSWPVIGSVTLGGAFPSLSLISSSINGQDLGSQRRGDKASDRLLLTVLWAVSSSKRGQGGEGAGRQARTGIRILLNGGMEDGRRGGRLGD